MASAGGDGIVYLTSLLDPVGANVGAFESHIAPVTDVALSISGLRMASGCKNGLLVFYHFSSNENRWSVVFQSKYSLSLFAITDTLY